MNIANRIYELRKQNGLSQEGLGEKLGVSRQAVSKWEAGGAVPETEKVVQMAGLFGVTTDYLLGAGTPPTESTTPATAPPAPSTTQNKTILACTLLGLGLLLAAVLWVQWQNPPLAAIGLLVQAGGVLLYTLWYPTATLASTRRKSNFAFFGSAVWLLLPLPCVAAANALMRLYPRPYHTLVPFVVAGVLYVLLGLGLSHVLRRRGR